MNIKKAKIWQLIPFLLICLGLNYGGRWLTDACDLPLWLDSMGTVLSACVGGPVIGALTGLTGNVLYAMSIHSPMPLVYAITNVILGIVIGCFAPKWKLDDPVGVIKMTVMTTLISVAISVPLNYFFYQGMTGSLWGDSVIYFLREHGFPDWASWLLGQYAMDFGDKVITMLLLFFFVRATKQFRDQIGKLRVRTFRGAEKTLGFLLAVAMVSSLLSGEMISARAEESESGEFTAYNNYVQTIYSSKNGLPCGEANDIAQTSNGILWVGTYAGLYRYNGQEFTWMNQYDSVRNVNCLYLDDEGRLWIGTNDSGLSIAIDEEITNVISTTEGLPSNSVRSIIQGADGYYYIGTSSSMQILNLAGGLKTVTTLGEVNYASDSAADAEGHVAAVTSGGTLFLLHRGQILCSRQLAGAADAYRSCCFDEEGRLLVGTSGNEIYVYDISEGYFQQQDIISCDRLKNLKDLTLLENGELFVSSDIGIGYLDAEKNYHYINTNDFSASIDNMLVDYQNNLWFTSSRLGLLRMTPSDFKDIYASAGLDTQIVNTVVRWQGNFYIGTDQGMDIVNPAFTEKIENDVSEAFQGIRIRCMIVDANDHLWVCTYGSGLMEVSFEGEEAKILTYNHENDGLGDWVRLVKELGDGTIMVGCDTGVSFLKDHRVTRTIGKTAGLINSMVLTATERKDGSILIGTDGDGIALMRDGQIERMITRQDGLSSEVILRTIADPKSEGVFIVTSNGLCYMREDFTVVPLNFPYFNNYDIYFRDEDTMFVLSSAGIYVVSRADVLNGTAEQNYELLDSRRGLNSSLTANSWNWCDEAGNLYLPCDNGLFELNVWNYSSSSHAYRMMISQIRANSEVLKAEGSSLTLDRDVTRLEIDPEIINYTIQDPSVGYWLEGNDREWTIQPLSNLKSIVYTNLPTGNYEFHLAVFGADGAEIIAERSWQISKTRALYDEPYFYGWLVLIFAMSIALFMILIIYVPYKQRLELSEKSIFAIASAVDARDERTGGHSWRVSQYSGLIAREMGLPEKECKSIERAALLHDIGKIAIPDSILNKPGRLTDEEYAIMKTHTTKGAEILKDLTFIPHVADGAEFHHERYDGRGYPHGMKGTDIPDYARIIGVADAFDAMSANRIYRKQMDLDYVMNEMKKGRGTQFDPEADDAFMRLIAKKTIDVEKIYADSQKAKGNQPGKEAGQA